MQVSYVIMALGASLMIGAWTFCRHPGQRFWVLNFPIWRSKEYMTPLGVKLQLTGLLVLYAGLFVAILQRL